MTHPELKATFQLDLIGVKKNPQSPLYTSLGTLIASRLGEEGWQAKGGELVSSEARRLGSEEGRK